MKIARNTHKTIRNIPMAYGKRVGFTVKLSFGSSVRDVSQTTIAPMRKSEPTKASSLFTPFFILF
jgi:hypothetical protein